MNDTITCDTWGITEGRCGEPATHVISRPAGVIGDMPYPALSAAACERHAAFWGRTKRVRGRLVRVNPNVIIEPLG